MSDSIEVALFRIVNMPVTDIIVFWSEFPLLAVSGRTSRFSSKVTLYNRLRGLKGDDSGFSVEGHARNSLPDFSGADRKLHPP